MVFSPSSIWNQRLPRETPTDPASAAIVANVAAEVAELGPGFNFTDYSVSIFYASASCPKRKVTIDKKAGALRTALEAMFAEVPIPDHARPVGPWFGDNHMAIYQPSTDTLWEGWRWSQFEVDGAHEDTETSGLSEEITHAPGWHIEEGACIKNVSQNPGYFTESSFPGVSASHAYSARASGLLLPGGIVTTAEAQMAAIPHALALSFHTNYNQPRWPAQRTDGTSTDPTRPWEGMLLRLPANVDLSGVKNPFGKKVNVALRDYGGIVCDKSGSPVIKLACESTKPGEHGYTTDAWKGPENKFGGVGAILAGNKSVAEEILWSQLEVVAESYRPSSSTPGLLPKSA